MNGSAFCGSRQSICKAAVQHVAAFNASAVRTCYGSRIVCACLLYAKHEILKGDIFDCSAVCCKEPDIFAGSGHGEVMNFETLSVQHTREGAATCPRSPFHVDVVCKAVFCGRIRFDFEQVIRRAQREHLGKVGVQGGVRIERPVEPVYLLMGTVTVPADEVVTVFARNGRLPRRVAHVIHLCRECGSAIGVVGYGVGVRNVQRLDGHVRLYLGKVLVPSGEFHLADLWCVRRRRGLSVLHLAGCQRSAVIPDKGDGQRVDLPVRNEVHVLPDGCSACHLPVVDAVSGKPTGKGVTGTCRDGKIQRHACRDLDRLCKACSGGAAVQIKGDGVLRQSARRQIQQPLLLASAVTVDAAVRGIGGLAGVTLVPFGSRSACRTLVALVTLGSGCAPVALITLVAFGSGSTFVSLVALGAGRAPVTFITFFALCARVSFFSLRTGVTLFANLAFFTVGHGKSGGFPILKGDGVDVSQPVAPGLFHRPDTTARDALLPFFALGTGIAFVALFSFFAFLTLHNGPGISVVAPRHGDADPRRQ